MSWLDDLTVLVLAVIAAVSGRRLGNRVVTA
jgi:hypothetical protein